MTSSSRREFKKNCSTLLGLKAGLILSPFFVVYDVFCFFSRWVTDKNLRSDVRVMAEDGGGNQKEEDEEIEKEDGGINVVPQALQLTKRARK